MGSEMCIRDRDSLGSLYLTSIRPIMAIALFDHLPVSVVGAELVPIFDSDAHCRISGDCGDCDRSCDNHHID